MKQDFLTNFITKAKEEQERVYALERERTTLRPLEEKADLRRNSLPNILKLFLLK
jgi:hypothetical protein